MRDNKEAITFTLADQEEIVRSQENPLIILAMIAKHPIGRILVDSNGSISLIYWNCFKRMNISIDSLKIVHSILFNFTRELVPIAKAI